MSRSVFSRRREFFLPDSSALLSADSFNRTDSTSVLGPTDGAGSADPLTWAQDNGTLGINTNQAYSSALVVTNGRLFGLAQINTSNADVYVSATITGANSNANGIVVRYTDVSNYWWWRRNATNNTLVKVAGGTYTAITGTWSGAVSGDVLTAVTYGNIIAGFRNGVLITAVSDAHNASATRHGFHLESTVFRVDNWSVKSLAV